MSATLAAVLCVLAHRGTHAPAEARETIAHAFLSAEGGAAPLDLLLTVGYVESRWSPTGSRTDRDHGVFGVMQLSRPDLVCRDRRGRPDERRCSPAQREARERVLDVATNVRIGAGLLRTLWGRFRGNPDWFGAYYVGSVPAGPSEAFAGYVRRVRAWRGVIRGWLRECGRLTRATSSVRM